MTGPVERYLWHQLFLSFLEDGTGLDDDTRRCVEGEGEEEALLMTEGGAGNSSVGKVLPA